MEDLNFLLNGLVRPHSVQMASFNIHEGSQLAVSLSVHLHVLEHVHLEVGVVENVVEGLC